MNQIFVGVLALCAAAVTALGTYIIIRHQRSGKVDTTDASDLWKEGKDLRDFLVTRIDAQDSEIKDLKIEVRDLKIEVVGLRAELKERWPKDG